MRRKINIILTVFCLIFASCEKFTTFQEDIILPPDSGYIKFSSKVATKAPIITSLKGDSFGVVGFSYPNYQNWSAAKVLAKPNLCHELTVYCDNNGVCTYDIDPNNEYNQYMLWNLLNNHTFFSYYPISTDSNGVTISDENTTSTPYIIYNLPINNQPVDPDNLMDIMTGYAIDQTVRSGEVGFTFQHRLCCIDVVSRNFTDVKQTVSDISIQLNGIQYNTVRIPMQKGDSEIECGINGTIPESVLFSISSNEDKVDIEPNATVGLSGEKNIILIPQKVGISGSIKFKKNTDTDYTIKTIESEFENFEEGKKYSIVINFTGNDVIVLMIDSGVWDVVPVQYEFD